MGLILLREPHNIVVLLLVSIQATKRGVHEFSDCTLPWKHLPPYLSEFPLWSVCLAAPKGADGLIHACLAGGYPFLWLKGTPRGNPPFGGSPPYKMRPIHIFPGRVLLLEWVIQWARGPSGTLGPIPHPAEGQAGQAFCSEVVQLIQGSLPKAESQVDALVFGSENDTYGLDYGLKD